jgi:NAD-dependent dihydropyrimidine dehydrogenase PreA subunit
MISIKDNGRFLYINNLLCVACGDCITGCPVKAISEYDSFFSINTDACTKCGTCKQICKKGAIGESAVLNKMMKA